MSKKSLILLVVTALTLGLALSVSMSFAEADKGPESITMNADGKKAAEFPHKAHQGKNECSVCHHKSVDGKKAPIAEGDAIAKCDTCHNADFANEKLRTWKDIGHGLCKDCHTKMKDAGAPTKCGACHPKKQ
ncbi:MAG: cytochrome c3 family protein [Desulfobulbales bacterium]|nr:cytochrome c3 family protein [Desulfobulbales bacterium]